jgi:hypothetical protein
MSIIIRIVVVATCAYAGSVVAGVQYPDLPDPYQMCKNKTDMKMRSCGEIAVQLGAILYGVLTTAIRRLIASISLRFYLGRSSSSSPLATISTTPSGRAAEACSPHSTPLAS